MLAGLLMVVAYIAVLLVLEKRSGVPYTDIALTAENTRRGVLIPVAIALALLLVYAVAAGRLSGAFSYSPTIGTAWLWVVPGIIAAGIVYRFARTPWRSLGGRRIAVLAVATALVGVSEELLVRGLLLDHLQDAGFDAVWVAVTTSIVFGLLHGMNVLLGQSVQVTLVQVVGTTLMGLALFTSLALTGSLWVPIVLHALYDLSVMVSSDPERKTATPLEAAFSLAPSVLAIGVLFVL